MQVIKPFQITLVREDADGYRTAFFDKYITLVADPVTTRQIVLSGSVRVPPDEDLELYVWNDLQDPKWKVS